MYIEICILSAHLRYIIGHFVTPKSMCDGTVGMVCMCMCVHVHLVCVGVGDTGVEVHNGAMYVCVWV